MARYAAFLGLQVEVQYRAGDILLPASGTFVGDTGRSIFLEQSFEQRGQRRNFRWEIPYQYIVKMVRKTDGDPVLLSPASKASTADETHAQASAAAVTEPSGLKSEIEDARDDEPEQAISVAAGLSCTATMIFPRPQFSET
jgi:hypothetical protein